MALLLVVANTILPLPFHICKSAVDCGSLMDPENGQVNLMNGTVFQSQATYNCNESFTLSGNTTRICQSSRQWSGSEPTCEGKWLTQSCPV